MSALSMSGAYVCRQCGHFESRWYQQCVSCGARGTIAVNNTLIAAAHVAFAPVAREDCSAPTSPTPRLVSVAPAPAYAPALPPRATSVPVAITAVSETAYARTTCGIEPIDRVLGGGLVPGSAVLLGGTPGAGKSTMLWQMLAGLGQSILYATAEESVGQVALRARRIGAAVERMAIVAEPDVDVILAHAHELRPAVLAVDSIQTIMTTDLVTAPGSVAQVKACASRLCTFGHDHGIAVILIGHVTKDGAIAGPMTLAHLVDVVLSLEIDDEISRVVRFLRTPKNRFGSTMESGALEMTATGLVPSELLAGELASDRDEIYQPLAQELLNRYLAGGGNADDGLRDRIGELLDMDMWRETR